MTEEREQGIRVKKIMSPIEEYDTVGPEDTMRSALRILKKNYEKIQANIPGKYHKTIFVVDESKNIVGKLSIYDLIRGLVPEPARKAELSRAYYAAVSSRTLEVADEIGEIQHRFAWLHTSFLDLLQKEADKKVKEIMSPVYPLVDEEDRINKAIYVMFYEKIRQPLVTRKGKVVGVVNLMDVFRRFLELTSKYPSLVEEP
ncbi:MAG: CBS domain-containing protein [Deltaproteobacteria bacterium]|nr:CBS domain-containing protein [Deltaproteobacteria bacterium]RLB89826.1 MAG: hypothetical protein DRH10_05215 [Deltaproteobacteria bacterium]RLC10657.1 MAG: hypothetical protein DRH43_05895 [Deltaproteobacteria bacterium]